MMLRWQPLAAIALLPMGIALADYADTSVPAAPPAPLTARPELRAFVEGAERSLDQVTRGVQELAIALQAARRDGDPLLSTCLSDALERARELTPGAIKSLNAVQQAATLDAARPVVAKIAQTNEALARVFEDASRCEGKDESERSSNGDNTVTQVETDSDPSTAHGFGDAPGMPIAVDAPAIIPPPPPPPSTIDTMDPIIDVEMPPTPPTASPMR